MPLTRKVNIERSHLTAILCKNCGNNHRYISADMPKYCPHCGNFFELTTMHSKEVIIINASELED